MFALPLLVAAVCAATPVHREPLPRSGDLSSLPWVQAAPHRAGIVGMLFGSDAEFLDVSRPVFTLYTNGSSPRGHSTKVLWLVRNRRAGLRLDVRGRRLDGAGSFHERFREVADASPHPAVGHEYASIVDVPAAGCWRLTVSSGRRVRGTFVLRAVAPS